MCEGCGDECEECQHGYVMSAACGVYECRRGPGDSCGGPSDALGVCGEGLSCLCNECTGCSFASLTCYTNTCLPHQMVDSRNVKLLKRFALPK